MGRLTEAERLEAIRLHQNGMSYSRIVQYFGEQGIQVNVYFVLEGHYCASNFNVSALHVCKHCRKFEFRWSVLSHREPVLYSHHTDLSDCNSIVSDYKIINHTFDDPLPGNRISQWQVQEPSTFQGIRWSEGCYRQSSAWTAWHELSDNEQVCTVFSFFLYNYY